MLYICIYSSYRVVFIYVAQYTVSLIFNSKYYLDEGKTLQECIIRSIFLLINNVANVANIKGMVIIAYQHLLWHLQLGDTFHCRKYYNIYDGLYCQCPW